MDLAGGRPVTRVTFPFGLRRRGGGVDGWGGRGRGTRWWQRADARPAGQVARCLSAALAPAAGATLLVLDTIVLGGRFVPLLVRLIFGQALVESPAPLPGEVVRGLVTVARYEVPEPRAVLLKGLEEGSQRRVVLLELPLGGLVPAHRSLAAQIQDHVAPFARGALEVG